MAKSAQASEVTRRIFVRGMVQGVGMRPFLALLARQFAIAGSVKNIGSNVEIIARAPEQAIAAFIEAIRARKPEMAEIIDIAVSELHSPPVGAGFHPRPPYDRSSDAARPGNPRLRPRPTDDKLRPHPQDNEFQIIPSSSGPVSMLPPDFPVCADCVREMNDPANRRHRHPFISCAVCGPRYSILQSAPYDRLGTSMADFEMCPDCAREYADPQDRRYHAQTVSCHACGPYLVYKDRTGHSLREDALSAALNRLKQGGIVAVKGVGGYHLACIPDDEAAVQRLRTLKGREQKPFAVMFRDIAEIEKVCKISPKERELLLSPARPIMLLKTKTKAFAPSVTGNALLTGAFLPYTPLQILLLEGCPALVMTSANRTGQPEIYEDKEMLAMLEQEDLSGVLYHSRRIVTRLDDSVAHVIAGERQISRRSRGYAPRPIETHASSPKDVIAYGSDLKSAFCLLHKNEAYMSQYFGNMEQLEVQGAYQRNLAHMKALFAFTPDLAVCDMHPGYHASRLAHGSGLPILEVQHHHAHIASVMAEHSLPGPVIGASFDGTGWGEDGAIWGGEFLLCSGGSYVRRAHLDYVRLAGGDSVATDARKAALCYCAASGVECPGFEGAALLRTALDHDMGTFRYSGMGRLFDAVAALLGLCHENRYEGQCAVALENEAQRANERGIPTLMMDFPIREIDGILDIGVSPIIRTVAEAGHAGQSLAAAAGFHDAICRMTAEVCRRIRSDTGINTVALSGGTFQNELVLAGTTRLLRESGFEVFTNNEVPCNDGGLALGQAYIAAMRKSEEL